jgi:hypothetical protein
MKTTTSPVAVKPALTAAVLAEFLAAYATVEHTLPFGTANLLQRLEVSDVLSKCVSAGLRREKRIVVGNKRLGKGARAVLLKMGYRIEKADPTCVYVYWS